VNRTASAFKLRRLQGLTEGSLMTHDTTRPGIGIDMASDATDESADRALTSVHRKLDKSLSVEYTVNELIVSATDLTNLANIFAGKFRMGFCTS
jgi:ataxia telangiectasia mutated family protein